MNQQEWLEYFELLNDRKPTAEEIAEAKETGKFTVESEEPTAEEPEVHEEDKQSPQEAWLANFEHVNGRKPSVAEFAEAKKAGFVNVSGENTQRSSEQATIKSVYQNNAVSSYHFCTNCGKQLNPTERFCQSCRFKQDVSHNFCWNCAWKLNADDTKCPKCGENANVIPNIENQDAIVDPLGAGNRDVQQASSSYQNRTVSSATQKATARNQAANKFLGAHWKGIIGTIVGIIVVLFIWNAGVSQTAPDGTYHSGDTAAIIGVMSFTDSSDTLTFNGDGTVTYTGGDSMSTQYNGGSATSDSGTYTLSNGYLTINMQIAGSHTFKYSKDIFGNLTLSDTQGNDFSFTKW